MRALVLLVALLGCGHSAKVVPPPAPVTVALVYPGWEVWVGNDQNPKIPADDPTRYPGALEAIKTALDQAELAKHTPPGSQGLVVTFDLRATVRVTRRAIGEVTGATLGAQDAYYGTQGNDLVQGVTTAIDELERAPAGRHVLVLLSDGNDVDNERAKPALAAQKARAAKLGIEVRSLIYKAALSSEGEVISAFAPTTSVASSAELVVALGRALAQ